MVRHTWRYRHGQLRTKYPKPLRHLSKFVEDEYDMNLECVSGLYVLILPNISNLTGTCQWT